ncbi:uncharacterized protein PFLUO_LOCUS9350 [Penicillium psychrofluorescens]|uniref:uncharacterized protein n=1 Tax=Penicillium psychrofluorescens TaxID=3158075 RepID=UPI003CCD2E12
MSATQPTYLIGGATFADANARERARFFDKLEEAFRFAKDEDDKTAIADVLGLHFFKWQAIKEFPDIEGFFYGKSEDWIKVWEFFRLDTDPKERGKCECRQILAKYDLFWDMENAFLEYGVEACNDQVKRVLEELVELLHEEQY